MLKDELDAYLNDLSQHATEGTVTSHRSTITRFIDECRNRNITTDELSTQWAAEYLAKVSATYRPATIRGKISTIANFFAYIQDENPELIGWEIRIKLTKQSGFSTVTQGTTNEYLARNEDLKQAIDAYLERVRNRAYGTRVHAATEIAVATGCRLKSIRKLNLDDLNLDTCELEVTIPKKHAVSQNGSVTARTVTLSEKCASAVRTYLEHERIPFENTDDTEPMFTTHHGRLSAATLQRSMQAMMDAACSDTTSDEAGYTPTQTDDGDGRQLSPRDIRRYYITQLTEK